MPTPVREDVLAAVKTALDGVAGATAYRNQYLPLKQAELPALVLFDGDEFSDADSTGVTIHTMTIDVEITATGATIGTTLNDLYAKTVVALTADVTLGGFSFDVRETGMELTEIDDSRASTLVAIATVSFEIDYLTAENDPYTIGAA